jgi:hypothetical protein
MKVAQTLTFAAALVLGSVGFAAAQSSSTAPGSAGSLSGSTSGGPSGSTTGIPPGGTSPAIAPGTHLNNSLSGTTGSGVPVPSGVPSMTGSPTLGTSEVPDPGTPIIDSTVKPTSPQR